HLAVGTDAASDRTDHAEHPGNHATRRARASAPLPDRSERDPPPAGSHRSAGVATAAALGAPHRLHRRAWRAVDDTGVRIPLLPVLTTMEHGQTHIAFVRQLGVAFLASCALVAAVNYAVDPYALFGTP